MDWERVMERNTAALRRILAALVAMAGLSASFTSPLRGGRREASGGGIAAPNGGKVATGELIGPDPELERPRTEEEATQTQPFKEVFPDLYENIQRSRGRPKIDDPKDAVTLRLPRSVIQRWQRDPDWRAKMAETLEKAV